MLISDFMTCKHIQYLLTTTSLFRFNDSNCLISCHYIYIVITSFLYSYILYAFTEQPDSKLSGRNVVYISIMTLSHVTASDVGSLQSDWMSLTSIGDVMT